MRETYATCKPWDGCRSPNNLESGSRFVGQLVSTTSVDRDALLAVADEIDESSEYIGGLLWCDDMRSFARRIREILGDDA